MPAPYCYVCQATFADFKELALHISKSRKGHRKGKKWAAKYILINGLSPAARTGKEDRGRIPLPENYKEIKKSTYRELSGDIETVPTFCPKCKITRDKSLPVEFTKDPGAWRVKGKIVRICLNCGGAPSPKETD